MITPGLALSLAVLGLTLIALVEAGRRVALWRVGGPAQVAWLPGILALPRRYLHDVHAVVARDPYASRMHALVAGGLIAGSGLLLLGLLPPLQGSRIYWGLVALAFAVMLAGALMVGKRRYPQPHPKLSRGSFQWLPLFLTGYGLGAFLVALDGTLGGPVPGLGIVGTVLACTGGLGIAAQLRRGPMRHALAGTINLIAHPRPGRFTGKPDTALRALDLDAVKLGAERPADFAWNRLASFDACIQCGRCEEACPAFAAGQPLTPKKLIQDLAAAIPARGSNHDYTGRPYPLQPKVAGEGGAELPLIGTRAMVHPDTLWACTTCRACVEACPMMIEHVDAIVSLRRHQVLELGALPEKAQGPLAELRHADEPGGRSLASRTDFAAGLDLPRITPDREVDVLLWLSEGAFDLRYGRSLRALVRLLQIAKVDFAVLGEEERDSGDLARRLGDEAAFQRIARDNIATFAKYRFRRILTADPHSLHVLRNEYPALGGCYEVVHHTTFLAELADRLPLGSLDSLPITYHDPCYLGRYNGEIEAPRRLLDRIGASRVEMERHGMRAMCCGGGGGAPVSDIPGERRIPDLRMAQAGATGAGIVAVACPGCTAMLEGVIGPRPEVRDIAELVLQAVRQ